MPVYGSGIMTSWMEEDGMLNGETLEQVLVRLDYLFKGHKRSVDAERVQRTGASARKQNVVKASLL